MIIRRKLFAKRRGLTPEEERERDKINHYRRTVYPSLGLSHIVVGKNSPLLDGGGKGTLNILESNQKGDISKEDEIFQVKSLEGLSPKKLKKVTRNIRRGKKGVIAITKDATSDVDLHESGHQLAIDEAPTPEDKDIAYSPYNFRSRPTNNLNEALENKKRVEEGGKRALRKEEMANDKGEELIKRYGGKYNTPEDIAQYREAREKLMEKNREAVRSELNRADTEVRKYKRN